MELQDFVLSDTLEKHLKPLMNSRTEFYHDSLKSPPTAELTEYWPVHICYTASMPPHAIPLNSGGRIEHVYASIWSKTKPLRQLVVCPI